MSEGAISKRQREVLTAIREHVSRWGVPPTRSELARALGYAHASGVNYNLRALERHGVLKINPGMDRGIQLLREGAPILDAAELPAVAAGNPIVACNGAEPVRLTDFDSFAAHFEARPRLVRAGRGGQS